MHGSWAAKRDQSKDCFNVAVNEKNVSKGMQTFIKNYVDKNGIEPQSCIFRNLP